MTLRRWTEEGASAHEANLLEASRAEKAPPELRARLLDAVNTGAATHTVHVKGWLGGFGTKVGLAALVGAAAVVMYIATRPRDRAAPTPPSSGATVMVEQLVPPAAETRPSIEAPVVSIEDLPRAATNEPKAARSVASASPSPSDDLAREMQCIDRARSVLQGGDARGALAQLNGCRREFPAGSLEPEEKVVRVRALVAEGNVAQAHAVVDEFARSHPTSLYTTRLRTLVDKKE